MKKYHIFIVSLLVAMIFYVLPAYAGTAYDVTTFGSTDDRNRDNYVMGSNLYLMYVHAAGGPSYSQPLILDGARWGRGSEYDGKTVVITAENNRLNGYTMSELLSGELLEQNKKYIEPEWSIPLSGSTPTKSHPTFYVGPDNRKYVFIGSSGPKMDIIDVTDLKNVKMHRQVNLLHTTDVTSAPLIMDWNNHMVVVTTSGNTAKIILLIDPLKEESESGVAYINAGSGRTSSSPAPLDIDGDVYKMKESFAVGLDQGTNRGELQIYNLDRILGIGENGQVEQISQSAEIAVPLSGGLVGSFSVDNNVLYFGDCRSQVYGYNAVTKEQVLYNGDLKGTFSNRSPAMTSSRIYFPAVGRTGQKGKLIAIDRQTGKKDWIREFHTNAQTAPVVLRVYDGKEVVSSAIVEGTSKYKENPSHIALLYPTDGSNMAAQRVPESDIKAGGAQSDYATGVSGEIGASYDTLVATTDAGVYIWRLLHTLDLEALELDTGVEGKAEPGKVYHGKFKFKFTGKIKADTPFSINNIGVGILLNDTPVQNLTANGTPLATINYNGSTYQGLEYIQDGQEITVEFNYTATGGQMKLTGFSNLDLGGVRCFWGENTYENNKIEKIIEGRSYDIKVKIIPEKYKFTSINGDITPVAGYVDVTRKDGLPGEISVTGSIKSKGETQYFEATLGPGEKESIDFGFPARPGTYVIEAEAWPVGTEDIYPPDNRDRVTISVDNKILNVDSEIWTETLR